jgi:hypothetical protein
MLPTLLLPYHVGSALVNLLFPVFVLVACGSDPAGKHCAYAELRARCGLVALRMRSHA